MEDYYFELEGYGVKLKRLTHDKIEMVRQWRNDPKISKYMFFRNYITPEMQEKWFSNLDKKCNYYFIIEYDGKDVGLINIKDIDWEKRCGESGIFIYDDKLLGSDIAYRSHLLLFDAAYNHFGLEYTYSHIQPENNQAIRFSVFLGALKDDVYSTDKVSMYYITKENYLSNKNRIRFLNKWNAFNKLNI
jgi:RimJ/RimL family protein N-acetyltransferase